MPHALIDALKFKHGVRYGLKLRVFDATEDGKVADRIEMHK